MLLTVIIVFFFLSIFLTLVKANMMTCFGSTIKFCMMSASQKKLIKKKSIQEKESIG